MHQPEPNTERVGPTGFEPVTRRLRVCRSNRAELRARSSIARRPFAPSCANVANNRVTEGTRTPNPQDHNLVL